MEKIKSVTSYPYAMVIVFSGKSAVRRVVTCSCLLILPGGCEMTKCSDLFNLTASLWHFDEKQLATFLFSSNSSSKSRSSSLIRR